MLGTGTHTSLPVRCLWLLWNTPRESMAVPGQCIRSGPDSQPSFSHRFHKDGPSHSYPSYGQAPHTARGRGCCPGCTGSYSQPGCAPVGASPQVTSSQNRCGFWNEETQGNHYIKTTHQKRQLHMWPSISNHILPTLYGLCSSIIIYSNLSHFSLVSAPSSCWDSFHSIKWNVAHQGHRAHLLDATSTKNILIFPNCSISSSCLLPPSSWNTVFSWLWWHHVLWVFFPSLAVAFVVSAFTAIS